MRDPDAAAPLSTPRVRGYELIEAIGSGPAGTVYRARQPVTERMVAVKVIRGDLADDPTFARAFEARAQRIARLEHPHVVPLHDFWREPGKAFLVHRLIDGPDLDRSRREGPWTVDRVTRFVVEVGAGLAAGHALGLVHGGIRGSNVLLDGAANAYLGDFAILDVPPWSDADPFGADCTAFTWLAWSMLIGRIPTETDRQRSGASLAAERPDVPLHLVGLLDAVTALGTAIGAADADERRNPGLVGRFVDDWLEAISLSASRQHVVSPGAVGMVRNPYKGLRAFEEGDAPEFFGRDRLVDSLVASVCQQRFVALVGPSGSGKSSVVQAGVVPRLRVDGAFVAQMRPGAEPFAALATAVDLAALPRAEVPRTRATNEFAHCTPEVDALESPASMLRRRLAGKERIVIIIDQLEELYTLTVDARLRTSFAAAIVELVHETTLAVQIVCTLRADFFDRPLADVSLGPLLRTGTIVVSAMRPDELSDCIRSPAEARGVTVEDGLVAQLVAEVSERPGSLPLLQDVLAELFDGRAGPVLTLDEYAAIGQLGGGLARRAERMYADLLPAQQELLPAVFDRLVMSAYGHPPTGRRSTMRDMPAGSVTVLDALAHHRLVSTGRDPTTREPVVELAHESLLMAWPRLADWLAAGDEDRRRLQQISSSATLWEAGGRADTDLYRGGRLETALDWRHEKERALTVSECDFLAHGERVAAVEARQHERTRNLLRRLTFGLAGLLVVALMAGSAAAVQWRQARRVSDAAETGRLLATAANLSTRNPTVALLLTIEGARRANASPLDVNDALLQTLTATPNWLGTATLPEPARRAVFDRTGRRLILVGYSKVMVVDRHSHRLLAQRPLPPSGAIGPLLFRGPGATVIVSDGAFDLRGLDDTTLKPTGLTFALPGLAQTGATSADGRVLAVGTDIGSVILWATTTGRSLGSFSVASPPIALAFDAPAMTLAVAERHRVTLWRTTTRTGIGGFAPDGSIAAVTFAGTDDTLVVSATDADATTVSAFDPTTGHARWEHKERTTVTALLADDTDGFALSTGTRGAARLSRFSDRSIRALGSPASQQGAGERRRVSVGWPTTR